MLKQHRVWIPLVVGVALIAGACGGDDDTATTTEPTGTEPTGTEPTATSGTDSSEDGPLLIYMTPNPIGVNEFLTLGEIGTEAAAAALGGTAQTFEGDDAASMRSNVEAALDADADVIVMTTFSMKELADEFSKANPDQTFVLIDACPDEPAPNIFCGVFREHEGAYLLGIEAGMLTESGVIGTVAALDTPFIHRWSDSFAAGAASVREVEDNQLFVGGDNPFGDPARAKEQALAMASQGADHVLAAAAGGNGGVFEAAVDQGFFAYGVDVNQCGLAPGSVIDNNLKRVDVVAQTMIEKALDGTASPITSFGLAEGGVGVVALADDVADSGCVIADHPDVVARVKEVAAQIIAGDIVVNDPLTAG